jgi:hypothetical protein
MQICSDNHEEVCYECRNCPMCELLDVINDLKEENDRYEKMLDSYEDRMSRN